VTPYIENIKNINAVFLVKEEFKTIVNLPLNNTVPCVPNTFIVVDEVTDIHKKYNSLYE
jgi:hypothetical protein